MVSADNGSVIGASAAKNGTKGTKLLIAEWFVQTGYMFCGGCTLFGRWYCSVFVWKVNEALSSVGWHVVRQELHDWHILKHGVTSCCHGNHFENGQYFSEIRICLNHTRCTSFWNWATFLLFLFHAAKREKSFLEERKCEWLFLKARKPQSLAPLDPCWREKGENDPHRNRLHTKSPKFPFFSFLLVLSHGTSSSSESPTCVNLLKVRLKKCPTEGFVGQRNWRIRSAVCQRILLCRRCWASASLSPHSFSPRLFSYSQPSRVPDSDFQWFSIKTLATVISVSIPRREPWQRERRQWRRTDPWRTTFWQ